MPLDNEADNFACIHCHRGPLEGVRHGRRGFCIECTQANHHRINAWLLGKPDPFLDMVKDALVRPG